MVTCVKFGTGTVSASGVTVSNPDHPKNHFSFIFAVILIGENCSTFLKVSLGGKGSNFTL